MEMMKKCSGGSSGSAGQLPVPYLLFVGDETDAQFAKTAFGLVDWARDRCIGELACSEKAVRTGLPRMSPAEAASRGARSVLIGVANAGGHIPAGWRPPLVEALEAGLDIVSGLHVPLATIPVIADTANRHGRSLIELRQPPPGLPVATGRRRSGKRLLTVGTDCALGKKYTALALAGKFRARGIAADFRATGQTGIMISGQGIALDAVVADFLSGAAELLSPDADAEHWDIIEGQGSLSHPAYAGVSLGLLHGSQPDVIVMCHEAGRTAMAGTAGYSLPSLEEAIDLALRLGRLTNPGIRCAGIAVNTSGMPADEAPAYLESESRRLGMPVADPLRGGQWLDRLVDACLLAP